MDFPLREYEFEYRLFGKPNTAYFTGVDPADAARRLQAEFSGFDLDPVLKGMRLVSKDEYEGCGEPDGNHKI